MMNRIGRQTVDDVRSDMTDLWTLDSERPLYEGQFNNLFLETYVGPDGRHFNREVVRKGDVVGLLLVHDGRPGERTGPDHIILLQQFRCGAKNTVLEIPAGTLEDGEDPFDCAQREAYEEVGAVLTNILYVSSFYLSPGWTDELCHLFYSYVKNDDMAPPNPQGIEEEYSSLAFLEKHDVKKDFYRFRDAKTMAAIGLWLNGLNSQDIRRER